MRIDKDDFIRAVNTSGGRDGCAGAWSTSMALWCARHDFPLELRELFETHVAHTEICAGAGALFGESQITRWNDNFPEALSARLLIVGSGPNGDHITIDLNNGATGYISHEHDWRINPRKFFVAVSPSIGNFLVNINRDPPAIPEDYWDAVRARS